MRWLTIVAVSAVLAVNAPAAAQTMGECATPNTIQKPLLLATFGEAAGSRVADLPGPLPMPVRVTATQIANRFSEIAAGMLQLHTAMIRERTQEVAARMETLRALADRNAEEIESLVANLPGPLPLPVLELQWINARMVGVLANLPGPLPPMFPEE